MDKIVPGIFASDIRRLDFTIIGKDRRGYYICWI